ncbi:MAG: glycosyltransferase family 2 protein [Verrucomicrobiota bacterium]
MSATTLTVITPVLNGTAFIRQCLESVAGQECDRAVHLVVDGNSTDGTQEIVRAFASEHPHVGLISEQDSGQSDAMNRGITTAQTPWIGFLNADDRYEPGTLNRVTALMDGLQEPSFIYGNLQVWGDNGVDFGLHKPAALTLLNLCRGKPYPLNPASYFYHKSLHTVAGPYAVDDHMTMDLDFLYRACQHANMHYFNELWGHFNLIEGTKTQGDIATGETFKRQDALRQKYLKNLPAMKRRWVKTANSMSPFCQKLARRLGRRT